MLKNSNVEMDKLLEKVIQEQYERIPVPSEEKQRVWNNIHKKMNQRPKKNAKIFPILSLAASLLFLGFLFMPINSGSAFIWFTNFFTKTKGTETVLISQSGEKDLDSPQEIQEIQEIPTENDNKLSPTQLLPLSEIQSRLAFTIQEPAFIPEGYQLEGGRINDFGDIKSNMITISYKKGRDEFQIVERYASDKASMSSSLDNEDTITKKKSINGSEATIFLYKDGTNKILWSKSNVYLMIRGRLSENDLIKIAQSM